MCVLLIVHLCSTKLTIPFQNLSALDTIHHNTSSSSNRSSAHTAKTSPIPTHPGHPTKAFHNGPSQLRCTCQAPHHDRHLFSLISSQRLQSRFVGGDALIFSRRNGDSDDLRTSVHNPSYVICMQFLLQILETLDGKGIQCSCRLHTRYDDGFIPFQ